MAISRKDVRGGRTFAFPVVGIAILLASYLLLVEWQDMPNLINGALATVHWLK